MSGFDEQLMILTPEIGALSNFTKLFTSNNAPKNASWLANVNEDFDAIANDSLAKKLSFVALTPLY